MDSDGSARTPTPENVATKRPRTSPTLQTPQRSAKRTPLRERVQNESPRASQNATVRVSPRQRRLPFQKLGQPSPVNQTTQNSGEKWSDAEIKALVEFVLFHSSGDSWPTHEQDMFWNSAGEFLQKRTKSNLRRTGKILITVYTCFI